MASSPRHVAHHGKGNGLRLGSGSGSGKDAGGNTGPNKNVRDKKLRRQLDKSDARASEATKLKKRNEVLLQEEAGFLEAEGMERTYKFTQQEIVKNVDISSAKKAFNLTLDELGPYCIDYTRNGRHLLLGGKKGHIAMFDWQSSRLSCEIQVKESIRDVQFLHNETMYAVAQKKYTYIYDRTGMEIHCLKSHIDVNRLQFLPYHFLLASVGATGYLKYQDTSTGQLVAEHRTKLGPCDVMRQNPWNAVLHLGHQNGTVTLWSPTMTTPLVKMLCHKGPLLSVALDQSGLYMVTSGMDSQLKVWDIRTFKPVHAYYTNTPASSVEISQGGLLGVGFGPHVQVWKNAIKTKATSPYLNHLLPGSTLRDLAFCPFEDVLGVGHSKGFASVLVPGAGEANIDTYQANPFQTTKQRQEGEVKALLDKIQPEMISLNPNFVGTIEENAAAKNKADRKLEWEANHPNEKFVENNKPKDPQRTIARKLRRRQPNVVDEKREQLRQQLADVQANKDRKRKLEEAAEKEQPRTALDRFKRVKRD